MNGDIVSQPGVSMGWICLKTYSLYQAYEETVSFWSTEISRTSLRSSPGAVQRNSWKGHAANRPRKEASLRIFCRYSKKRVLQGERKPASFADLLTIGKFAWQACCKTGSAKMTFS